MHDDDPKTRSRIPPMTDPRSAILRRRARFVAAAVATVGLASACEKRDMRPEPCLSVMPEPSPSASAAPSPAPVACLSVVAPRPIDAGSPAADSGAADAEVGSASGADAGAKKDAGKTTSKPPDLHPMICLSDDSF